MILQAWQNQANPAESVMAYSSIECDNSRLMAARAKRQLFVVFLLLGFGPLLSAQSRRTHPARVPEYTFQVIGAFPHDPHAFTQGLVFHGGFLYEGTGLKGRSSLRKVRLETGEIVQEVDLAPEFFGEGISIVKTEIVQLTWQSQIGFVYNLSDFHLLRQFSYSGEGWGLTTDGHEVFMSDGTPEMRVLDPGTLTEKRRFTVHDGTTQIKQLNELEFVEGEIFANVWQTNRIARISPRTGEVLGWIDLEGLLSPVYRLESGAVLNGIAYDGERKRLFVTGKLWPKIFEIQLVPKP
ncbi:MAG: glutaminyl-peptide cyclotransferase [Candidatus Sulfotelmatobacter sp.]